MHQMVRVHTRTTKLIELFIIVFTQRYAHQGFGNPVRVHRTTGDINHLIATLRSKILTQQTARHFAVKLQAGGIGIIGACCRNAAVGRTATNGNSITGNVRQCFYPLNHGLAGTAHYVKLTGAHGAGHHRAFDTKNIQCNVTGQDPLKHSNTLITGCFA